jgi:hypothetical protein
MGKFTSADSPFADQRPEDPQSWNLYAYVRNTALAHIDSDGRACVSLNASSPFCQHATFYGQLDSKVGQHTRFFAAASAASQLLAGADLALPGTSEIQPEFSVGRLLVSQSTRDVLNDIGVMLNKENPKLASSIENGSLTGPGLDAKMVHAEQTFVQGFLDNLKVSNPQAYAKTIAESNNALNATGLRAFAQTRYVTDAAYAKILDGVRKSLGGKSDFANQAHREAIGNALVNHINNTGGCDVAGDKILGCR